MQNMEDHLDLGHGHTEHNRTREGDGEATERIFESQEALLPWQKQLTVRGVVVSMFLSVLFTIIGMKMHLTTGIVPSMNVSAGLLGFFFVKIWTAFLEKSGLLKLPFTRQENTVIQTCVVASSGIVFSGGFGSYLFAMSDVVVKQSTEANSFDVKNPTLSWTIPFLFIVSFIGVFCVVPLLKTMIVEFRLAFPSATATAHLINSFHTPLGAKLAKEQVRTLGKFFSFSLFWSFFQWFFTAGDHCGFVNFPTFGLEAYQKKFYFDFSATYVGVGMISPYTTNLSLLFGAILSWGFMWPLIRTRTGDWYPANLGENNLHGLEGYKVFIAISIILGAGLYNLVKVLSKLLWGLYKKFGQMRSVSALPALRPSFELSYDDERRTHVFLKDQIPTSIAITGYVSVVAISAATLPHIFRPLHWYYIVIIHIFGPMLAFCNAYGCGITDFNLASMYAKLAIFVIGAWAGAENYGVLAGLAAGGVMMSVVAMTTNLIQGFKTSYMTLASPRSMFASQIIGTAMGCVISPCVFWLFRKAFKDLGMPDSQYTVPYALIFRNVAIVGVDGFSSLPRHCVALCCAFFIAAIVVNGIRDAVETKWASYVPIPMAMAIPFFLGANFAIDMCVGSLILFIWQKMDKEEADGFGTAVASGLICGDGIWTLPSSILALANVKPPICMKFLSRSATERL